ncbi:hypothetical protein LCGC14_2119300 [marine sediment metagenome]|uniref:Uncharacterized protein n=1 Tax=marine sediment metagenome TaxID=412755 RepID=A0A0F9E4Q9_9ZZZZ
MTKLSECPTCQAKFEADLPLQMEITHSVTLYGPERAEDELNELYEDFHAEHEEEKNKEGE